MFNCDHLLIVSVSAMTAIAPDLQLLSSSQHSDAFPSEPQSWDLSDLYDGFDDPRLAQDLEYLRVTAAETRDRYHGKVAILTPDEVAEGLKQIEAIATRSGCICNFPLLVFSANTRDGEARQMLDNVRAALSNVSNQILFFDLELQALDEDAFTDLQVAPALEPYWHYLDRMAQLRDHRLSEDAEQLLNQRKLTGRDAFVQLHTLHRGEQDYAPVALPDGTTASTEADLRSLMYHPVADIRLAGYASIRQVLQQHNSLHGFILNTLCQDHRVESQVRQFDSTLHKQLLTDEVEEPVFRTIMDGTHARYDLFQRYYRFKAEALGHPIRICDLYAPWTTTTHAIPYGTGVETLLTALKSFDEYYAHRAQEFFVRHWVDAKVKPGKRGGAFCCYTPGKHSYLMLSYTNDYNSLFTLAHEMGHGLHYAWTGDRQSYFNANPPLVLAEVASTFNELLLLDHLLSNAGDDPALRQMLLAQQLENQLNLLFRQSTISRLELLLHDKATTGSFDHQFVNTEWLRLYHELCGDAVEILPGHQYDWAAIGHIFFKPFYCYQYTASTIVSLACYQRYREEGESFIPGYLELLGLGSSQNQLTALRDCVGVDLANPTTIEQALHYVEDLLDQLQATLS